MTEAQTQPQTVVGFDEVITPLSTVQPLYTVTIE